MEAAHGLQGRQHGRRRLTWRRTAGTQQLRPRARRMTTRKMRKAPQMEPAATRPGRTTRVHRTAIGTPGGPDGTNGRGHHGMARAATGTGHRIPRPALARRP